MQEGTKEYLLPMEQNKVSYSEQQNKDKATSLVEPTSLQSVNRARDTLDALIYEIAEHFGEMPDKVMGHSDEFNRQGGNELGLRAAFDAAKDRGYGYFRTLLKADKFIRVEPERPKTDSAEVDWMHKRYHDAQASSADTAAKRLARAAGLDSVKCPCGEEFPIRGEGS